MDPEAEMKELVVEALHKSIDLTKSDMNITEPIKREIMRVTGITEKGFQEQLVEHIKAVDKIRESIEQGEKSIDSAFKIAATGTGILLYLQSVMHSLRIAKQKGEDLKDSKRRITVLNKTRLRYVGGSEDDQISLAVKEAIK
ncbi:MAG: hypothetical protein ACREBB_11930 [Nitrosotalea sp.]